MIAVPVAILTVVCVVHEVRLLGLHRQQAQNFLYMQALHDKHAIACYQSNRCCFA
jgi:hypothetical protein